MVPLTPHIGLICFIADPFDPPGYERYGGGHLFVFDLGRFLVQRGYSVSFFTRLNSPEKVPFDKLGPNCSIYRLEVGPAEELSPSSVSGYVNELSAVFEEVVGRQRLFFTALHSHYWIAGEVARRFCVTHGTRHVHSVLSLGRVKIEAGEPPDSSSSIRDECELRVFNSANALLTVCPTERTDLQRLYPEVDLSQTYIIPYGVDPDVFYLRPESEHDSVRRQALRFSQGPGTAL